MIESLETIGSAAGGGFLGVLLAWLGIKARLDGIEKFLERTVQQKTCDTTSQGLSKRIDNASDRFDRIDAKIEVILQILLNTAQRSVSIKEEKP